MNERVVPPEIAQNRRNFKAFLEFVYTAIESDLRVLRELSELLKAYYDYSRLINDEVTADLTAFLDYCVVNAIVQISELEGMLAEWRRDFNVEEE